MKLTWRDYLLAGLMGASVFIISYTVLSRHAEKPEPYTPPPLEVSVDKDLWVVSAEFDTEMEAQIFKAKVEEALHGNTKSNRK